MPALQKWEMKSRAEERAERRKAEEAHERKVFAAIDKRDGLRDRYTGQLLSKDGGLENGIHRHHLVMRSAGGKTTTENMCCVGPITHAAIHAGKLTPRKMTKKGADGPLEFTDNLTGKRVVSLPPNTVQKLTE